MDRPIIETRQGMLSLLKHAPSAMVDLYEKDGVKGQLPLADLAEFSPKQLFAFWDCCFMTNRTKAVVTVDGEEFSLYDRSYWRLSHPALSCFEQTGD